MASANSGAVARSWPGSQLPSGSFHSQFSLSPHDSSCFQGEAILVLSPPRCVDRRPPRGPSAGSLSSKRTSARGRVVGSGEPHAVRAGEAGAEGGTATPPTGRYVKKGGTGSDGDPRVTWLQGQGPLGGGDTSGHRVRRGRGPQGGPAAALRRGWPRASAADSGPDGDRRPSEATAVLCFIQRLPSATHPLRSDPGGSRRGADAPGRGRLPGARAASPRPPGSAAGPDPLRGKLSRRERA